MKKNLQNKKNVKNTVIVPKTPAQLRSMTKGCKKSVLKSLQIPEIERIGDHTCLSIIDIIARDYKKFFLYHFFTLQLYNFPLKLRQVYVNHFVSTLLSHNFIWFFYEILHFFV